MRILLIDGNKNELAVNRDFLEALGHQVIEVSNVDDALSIFSEEDFDLVLTELNLPGSIGLTLVESFGIIKPETPVVVLTEGVSIKKAVKAIKLKAADVVIKPIDAASMESLLGQISQKVATRRSLSDDNNGFIEEINSLRLELKQTQIQFKRISERLKILEEKAHVLHQM